MGLNNRRQREDSMNIEIVYLVRISCRLEEMKKTDGSTADVLDREDKKRCKLKQIDKLLMIKQEKKWVT